MLRIAALAEAVHDLDPGWTAIIDGDRRIEWATFHRRVALAAGVLASSPRTGGPLGYEAVGLCASNCPEHLEVLVAASRVGMVPFNLNHRYTPNEMARLLAEMRPAVVVVDDTVASRVQQAASLAAVAPRLLVLGAPAGGLESYEAALEGAEPHELVPTPDALSIMYTGGTTGHPKAVVWREHDLVARALGGRRPRDQSFVDDEAEMLGLAARRTAGRVLPLPPFMHGTGQWQALRTLLLGGTVVLPSSRRFDPTEAVARCAEHDVDHVVIAGDAFALALADAAVAPAPSVIGITSSGARLSPGAIERLWQVFPNAAVTDVLGSSETARLATRTLRPGEGDDDEPGWVLTPGALVVSDDGQPMSPDDGAAPGLLAAEGRLPLGYLSDLLAGTDGSVYRTVAGRRRAVPGDRVRWQGGKLVLLGRGSQVINTGGEKVFAEEVEDALIETGLVRDAVVMGAPHPRLGEQVSALVVPAADELDIEHLRTAVRDQLAGYKVPRVIVAVPEVPRLDTGKVDLRASRLVLDALSEPAAALDPAHPEVRRPRG